MSLPQRIVCLTQETTEVLYLLGQQQRIVGISGYTVKPAVARREKPRIAAYTSAKLDKILQLQPDLVLGFSDLQADIAAALIKKGINVLVFNQRSLQGIFDMIDCLAALVGAVTQGQQLQESLQLHLQQVAQQAQQLPTRPRIYFEEWDEPLIHGIQWITELVGIAGGENCFADTSGQINASQRIIADANDVIAANPDILIASWCGKKFNAEKVRMRPGWSAITAVRNNDLFEIKACDILAPGPSVITDGLTQVARIVQSWAGRY